MTSGTLVLDGQADLDTYAIWTTGTGGASRNYVINVLDTGAAADGVDALTVNGGSGADIFLLRRVAAIASETATRPAFVALLHASTLAVARTPLGTFDVERVGYDAGVDALTVNGLGGNDAFASDDTSTPATLNGGAGDDTFQVGQLYGQKRDSSAVAGNDVFGTIATTRGWLSAGISYALTANGDAGNDSFSVYANQAALTLNGGDGNDEFVVRAFALAATTGDCTDVNNATCQISWRDATNRIAMPKLVGNQVQYVENATVSIDGGNGVDKVVTLATEFADHIAITSLHLYGVGLQVTYTNTEILEVDGMEGDDIVEVLSTLAGMVTRAIGGLGSDVINVTGDIAGEVIPGDTSGTKGSHRLSSIAGPLVVEGGTTAADRSLHAAVLMPHEANAALFAIAAQPPEAQQVDVLNALDDADTAGATGTMTATALTGLGMGAAVDFTSLLGGGSMPFGESSSYPGGISYGSITWTGRRSRPTARPARSRSSTSCWAAETTA